MGDDDKTIIMGCGGCCGLGTLIFFIVMMTNYWHLGPNEQVRIRSGRNYTVTNGPWSGQLSPFKQKERQQAIVIDGAQYIQVKNIYTQIVTNHMGPQLYFLLANESFYKKDRKLVLEVGDYIRYINTRSAAERILEGPLAVAPTTLEYTVRGVEKAVPLNDQQGVYVWTPNDGIKLVTVCTHDKGIYVPQPNEQILQVVEKVHILPHQAIVSRSGEEQFVIKGTDPAPPEACETGRDNTTGAGLAFFLKPQHRIMRMQWSNHSVMPADAVNTTSTTAIRDNTRRRRSTRNEVVLKEKWPLSGKPSVWLVADDFDPVKEPLVTKGCSSATGMPSGCQIWRNRAYESGAWPSNQENITVHKTGGPRLSADGGGNGALAGFASIEGTSGDIFIFGDIVPSTFTICSLTRWKNTERGRVLADATDGDWYHGHNSNQVRGTKLTYAGVASYGRSSAVTQIIRNAFTPQTDWLPLCGTNGGSTPHNVMLKDRSVGTKRGGSKPRRLAINKRADKKSSWGFAELLIWNKALGQDEMQEVMDYFTRRIRDASMYRDQSIKDTTNVASPVEKYRISGIDLRMQKSFFKFQVRFRTAGIGMVVCQLEGTIFWQIVDVEKMILETSDPEADIYSETRATWNDIASNNTFTAFMEDTKLTVDRGFASSNITSYLEKRGMVMHSVEVSKFEPLEATTIASLRTRLDQNVRSIKLEREQIGNDTVRAIRLQGQLAIQANKTKLIDVLGENKRLEAATAGSTQGSRKAQMLNAFFKNLKELLPEQSALGIVRNHLKRKAAIQDAAHLGDATAKIFVLKDTMNLSLQLPHEAVADGRRMSDMEL